jgi:glycosyltransferase involved in cell wall biosynthesis
VQGRRKVVVVAQRLGLPSQTWVARQLQTMNAFTPSVLTWETVAGTPPLGAPVVELPFDPEPYAGAGRWMFRLRHAGDRNFFGALGAEARALSQELGALDPDVVLCHFGHTALRLLPVARSLGIPLVAHFHGMDLAAMLDRWFYRSSLLRHFRHFDASIVVGSFQLRILEGLGLPTHQVHVIPCGVPTQMFVPGQRTEPGPIRFVSVGRLVEEKGMEECLLAFAKLGQALGDAELTIVGEGPDRERLRALTDSLGITSRVTFAGALTPAAVAELLSGSDIYVQHSHREGFGVALAEAASAGLPVVSTDVGGIPDQVVANETGFLIDVGDVAGMARAMARLGTDPALRAQLGTAGRRRMVEKFDTRSQTGKLEAVLLSVLKDADRK